MGFKRLTALTALACVIQFIGFFGPTQISTSGNGPPPITIPGESFITVGMLSGEVSIFALEKESLIEATTFSDRPNILSAQYIAREYTRGSTVMFHKDLLDCALAVSKAPAICEARNNDSGSLADHDIVMSPPGPLVRLDINANL